MVVCKGHSPIVSREEASPFPDDLCLSGETDEETETTGEESARESVAEWLHKAQQEELGGCPALAETYWLEAFLSSQSPLVCPQLSSQVSIRFGHFLCKFLPSWELPAYYFHCSLAAERIRDPSSRATHDAALCLARCLANAENYAEAAAVVATVETEDEEMRIRARSLAGRIRCMAGDLLQAEQGLRENVAAARNALARDSEAFAEVLTDFAATLLDAEKWVEAEGVAAEAVEVGEGCGVEALSRALRVFAGVCSKAGKVEYMKTRFEALVRGLRTSRAHPYVEAEVLTILADATSECQRDFSTSLYLHALHLYKSVKPTSWYVATLLTKLHTDGELAEVLDQLPGSSVLASCSASAKCVQKLISKVASDPEDPSTGEMLLHLSRLCVRQTNIRNTVWTHISEYLVRHSNTRVAAKLQLSITDWKVVGVVEKEHTLQKSLELHCSLKTAPSEVAALLRRIAALREGQIAVKVRERRLSAEEQAAAYNEVLGYFEESLRICRESAERSLPTGECLKSIAFFHTRRGNYEQCELYLKQALSVFSAMNASSSKSVEVMTSLSELYDRVGNSEAAEEWMRRALEVAWKQNPASAVAATAFTHLLTHFDVCERSAEAISLYSECCEVLKGRCAPEFRAKSREFVAFLVEKVEVSTAKSRCKQCVLSCLEGLADGLTALRASAIASQAYIAAWLCSQKSAAAEAVETLRGVLEQQQRYTEVEQAEILKAARCGETSRGKVCLRTIRSCYQREESA